MHDYQVLDKAKADLKTCSLAELLRLLSNGAIHILVDVLRYDAQIRLSKPGLSALRYHVQAC